MTPLPHHYEVRLSGGPSGHARLSASGLPSLGIAAPSDFDGPGDAWSPEHLLVAAVQTCFLMTLRAIARNSKIDIVSVEVTAVGTVDRQDGVTRFTEIVLRPRVIVAAGTDHDRALRVIEKSEKGCLVSASLSTPIRMEPEIGVTPGAPVTP
jgi:peroxiredoxin-like protein